MRKATNPAGLPPLLIFRGVVVAQPPWVALPHPQCAVTRFVRRRTCPPISRCSLAPSGPLWSSSTGPLWFCPDVSPWLLSTGSRGFPWLGRCWRVPSGSLWPSPIWPPWPGFRVPLMPRPSLHGPFWPSRSGSLCPSTAGPLWPSRNGSLRPSSRVVAVAQPAWVIGSLWWVGSPKGLW